MSAYDSGRCRGHFISFSGLFPHPPTTLDKGAANLKVNFTAILSTRSRARQMWPRSRGPCESLFAANSIDVPHSFPEETRIRSWSVERINPLAIDAELLNVTFLDCQFGSQFPRRKRG